MNIIEQKIKALNDLQESVQRFENAVKNVENTLENLLLDFGAVDCGKTLNAIRKQYVKRIERALKALRGESRKGANDDE